MPNLRTEPNIPDPDGFYADLIEVYESIDETTVSDFSARLILLLTNHIGDRGIISMALEEASRTSRCRSHADSN